MGHNTNKEDSWRFHSALTNNKQDLTLAASAQLLG